MQRKKDAAVSWKHYNRSDSKEPRQQSFSDILVSEPLYILKNSEYGNILFSENIYINWKWKIEISADLIATEKMERYYEQYGNASLNKMMNSDKTKIYW